MSKHEKSRATMGRKGIHVLHVVPTLGAGGMELAMARVISGLIPQGFSHSIAVLKGEPIIKDRIDPAVRIHCLHAQAGDPTIPLRLRRLIQQEQPTVIHARNLWAWPEVALARLMAWPLTPLIFSFHGLFQTGPLPWRWRLLSRLLGQVTTRMFTVSQGSKQFLVDHIGLSASRIDVIPNGVDTTRFSPRPRTSNAEDFVIGTVGSLSAVKNQALLVRACHRLLEKGMLVRLEIAGEGPERANLESLVAVLGMTEHVRLCGHVADTPGFLRGLDIFVLPSDSEAHPNALSEAAACGLACIASRVGGIPEIVDQGRAARLFEKGDEVALAGLIEELRADPAQRKQLGISARNLTIKQYSMDTMLERYRELYQGFARRNTHFRDQA